MVWPRLSGTKACCPLLFPCGFKYSKPAVKFADVVEEIDHAHEQEMMKRVI